MELGDRIRVARIAAGLSQTELAAAVGVTRGLIGAWETFRKKPGRDNLAKISDVLTVDIGYLLEGRPNTSGVVVDDPEELAMLRLFRVCSARQRKNILDLLAESVNVRREIERQRRPAKPNPVGSHG